MQERVQSVEYKHKTIYTGSIALFSSAGCIGGCIRCAQKETNPLGVSHVGIVVIASPFEVYHTLTTSPHLSDEQRIWVQKQIVNKKSEEPEIFVLEATGSMTQVFNTGYPFVTISQFSQLEENYDGNIYLRPCLTPVEFDWEQYLGISYERDFLELVKSTRRKNYRNSRQQVFCSELVAWILNQAGWYKNCPSNCTPAELGAWNKLENFADFQIY